MHVSVLNAIISSAVVTGWLVLGGYCYLGARRGRARQADWARLAPQLSKLDADLDLIWTTESGRITRNR